MATNLKEQSLARKSLVSAADYFIYKLLTHRDNCASIPDFSQSFPPSASPSSYVSRTSLVIKCTDMPCFTGSDLETFVPRFAARCEMSPAPVCRDKRLWNRALRQGRTLEPQPRTSLGQFRTRQCRPTGLLLMLEYPAPRAGLHLTCR